MIIVFLFFISFRTWQTPSATAAAVAASLICSKWTQQWMILASQSVLLLYFNGFVETHYIQRIYNPGVYLLVRSPTSRPIESNGHIKIVAGMAFGLVAAEGTQSSNFRQHCCGFRWNRDSCIAHCTPHTNTATNLCHGIVLVSFNDQHF